MQRSHSFARLKSWFAPPDRLVQVARITSGVVMLAGCLVLIGWKLDLAILKSLIPGAATTKANTAVCFLLAGISLSFQTSRRTRLATQLADGCAIAVSTIGLLTLSQYIFGWQLGIDELLVRPLATIASDPGRMGINAAIDFSLVGIALWLANRQEPQPQQRQHRIKLDSIAISQSLALMAGFIALQAVVGYAYNVRVFYRLSIFTTAMAFQTAIVFVVLCGGILALSSKRSWMRSLTSDLVGGDVARRFVPIAIVVPLVLGWLILRGHQANFYETNFAFSLMSISLVAILLGLISLNADTLNRVDDARIRSADRIRASEERLQLALESANQGIWSLDSQTQVVTWDDRCKAILGLSPDVLLTYAQRLDMLHPEDRDRVAEAMAIASREGGEFVQEYRTIYPNGTLRWALCQGRGNCDAAGRPTQMSGTMMDITDRKQLEATMQQQLGEIEAIYRAAPIGLCFVNTKLEFVRIDERLAQIDGSSVFEHLGRKIRDVLPEMAERLEPIYQQVINSGESILDLEITGTTIAQPGVARYWLGSYYPQTDNQHRVVGVNVMVQDITEQQSVLRARKQAEAALRESAQQLQTLADNMSQLAWMAEPDGGIFWCNRRCFEYTGRTLAQIQSWGWQELHHPEHVDRVVTHFQHCLAQGTEWEDTFPLRGHDGTYRWFLSRAIPIFDESGRVIRWFGTNTDITEQQTALQEIEQAQAALTARNHELDSFVHIVAHDLKAPLRGIINLSQWIEDDLAGLLSEQIQSHTTLLRSRVRRMEATIDGLLAYARVGRIDATSEPVVVSELIAETIDSIAPPATFNIVIDPLLPTLHAKRLFLSQVFANLITNGIKHHDRVDGTLRISSRDRGDVYEFAVADDGPGIDPAHHTKIFAIFQAINPQTIDSTGIGLSIVKKIVEAEGGNIWLESDRGRGTTFFFTWPKTVDDSIINN